MTYEKIFAEIKKIYSKSDHKKLGGDFAIQFNISGDGEGVFYLAYKDGYLDIAPYDYIDNDIVLYATGDTFIKLAQGKFEFEKAVKDGLITYEGKYELACQLNLIAAPVIEKKAVVKKPAAKKPAVKKPVAKTESKK